MFIAPYSKTLFSSFRSYLVPQFELLLGAFSFTVRLCVKYYVAQSVFAQRREGLQKAQNQNRALPGANAFRSYKSFML